jgi:hypothetical protein
VPASSEVWEDHGAHGRLMRSSRYNCSPCGAKVVSILESKLDGALLNHST